MKYSEFKEFDPTTNVDEDSPFFGIDLNIMGECSPAKLASIESKHAVLIDFVKTLGFDPQFHDTWYSLRDDIDDFKNVAVLLVKNGQIVSVMPFENFVESKASRMAKVLESILEKFELNELEAKMWLPMNDSKLDMLAGRIIYEIQWEM